MSTTVSKLASVAENMDLGLPDSVNWNQLSNALTNNNQYAFAVFTVGNTKSNYLYVHNFNVGLPDTAIIEGIYATVKKRATGPVEDYYVGLIYDSGGSPTITSPNKALPGFWSGLAANAFYGGATDLWNKSWTYSEINTNTFGFAISAEGDGSTNNGPLIDYIQLDITYHQLINQPVNVGGSGRCAGSAEVTSSTTLSGTGGAFAAGHAALVFDEFVDTGSPILASGTAPNVASFYMNGGIVADSPSIVNVNYKTDLDANQWSFHCLGRHDIPPDPSHANVILAYVSLNPANNTIHYEIRHDLTPANAVRFRGPANQQQTGSQTFWSVDANQSTASPIFGTGTVTAQQTLDIQNGLCYLFVRQDSNSTHLRGQVMNQTCVMSGSATVLKISDVPTDTVPPSAKLNNTAIELTIHEGSTSGGAYAAGAALVIVQVNIIASPALANGQADTSLDYNPSITAAGGTANGSASNQATFNPEVTDSGLAGGAAIIGIMPYVSGAGSLAAGDAGFIRLISPPISGGALLNGYHVLQQTYAPPKIKGGVRVIGSWLGELLKPIPPKRHLGYALAMKSENILNKQKSDKLLMDPVGVVSPVLDENRFTIAHEPGWCDVGDPCDSAYLPKIVQRRQGKYLPPKQGRKTRTDRQIAQADST